MADPGVVKVCQAGSAEFGGSAASASRRLLVEPEARQILQRAADVHDARRRSALLPEGYMPHHLRRGMTIPATTELLACVSIQIGSIHLPK